MRIKLIALFAIVSTVAAFAPPAAIAAPQILGLVATAEPVPLSCAGGICSAEISAVCLQEHRPAPDAGTAYRPAQGAALTLVVESEDGVQRELPVAGLVKMKSLRIFTSLSVSLPEHIVRSLGSGIVQASLSVGPLASALPAAVAGDKHPLSNREISDTTGPLRTIAEMAIGRDVANLAATRVLNHMINRLPVDRPADGQRIPSLRNQTLPNQSAAENPAAAKLVDRALETCAEKLRVEATPHLRACIANQHDNLITNTTQAVWRSLRPGG
ncbi:MAG: hypothetical protein HQ503_18010 [Rhodospirillales bacterium]|nr:hypothetical protein [Rhodospirillales bacterium]